MIDMSVKYYLSLGACLLVIGCGKNEDIVSQPIEVVLTASSSQVEPESKVSIDEATMTTCTWSENDEISVFSSSGSFKTFVLKSGAGSKTGKFAATLAGDETVSDYAVYPAGQHSFSNGNLKVNLPESYAFVRGVSNIPMISTVDESKILKFKHCGGVIRFALKNITYKGSFVFYCYTHRVTGDFDVDFSGEAPVINAVEDEDGSTVTIYFDKPDSGETIKYFYVPVPVGAYSNFTIKVFSEDGTEIMHKDAANDNNYVTRGSVLKMRTLTLPTFHGGTE